jgi:hypothetical protein
VNEALRLDILSLHNGLSRKTKAKLKSIYSSEDQVKSIFLKVKEKFPNEYAALAKLKTEHLGGRATVNASRLFYMVHGRYPVCPGCGKPQEGCEIAEHPRDNGKRSCSTKCANKVKKERREATCLERYKVRNIFSNEKFKENRVSYLQAKYGEGVTAPLLVQGALHKVYTTSMDRYGVTHFARSAKVRSKTEQTNKARYGVSSYLESEKCRDQLKAASMKKYGVPHPSMSEEVKLTKLRKSQEKFGTDNPMQHESCKEKARKMWQARIGFSHPMKDPQEFIKRMAFRSSKGVWRGHTITYQGAEMKVLRTLENNIKVDGVKMWGRSNGITYNYKGAIRTYFPDFLIRLKSGKILVVEVKSLFTLLWGMKHDVLNKNKAKFKAGVEFAKENGYEFVLAIHTTRGVAWVRDPTSRLLSRLKVIQ